jgi:hypothetical protein
MKRWEEEEGEEEGEEEEEEEGEEEEEEGWHHRASAVYLHVALHVAGWCTGVEALAALI